MITSVNKFNDSLVGLQKQWETIQTEVSGLNSRVNTLVAENGKLQSENGSLQDKLAQQKTTLSELNCRVQSFEDQGKKVENLQQRVNSLVGDKKTLEVQAKTQNARIEELEKIVSQFKTREQRISKFAQEISSLYADSEPAIPVKESSTPPSKKRDSDTNPMQEIVEHTSEPKKRRNSPDEEMKGVSKPNHTAQTGADQKMNFEIAYKLYREQKYPEAIEGFKKVLSQNSEKGQWKVWYYIARCTFNLKNYEQANKDIKESLACEVLDKDRATVYQLKAQIHLKLGQMNLANSAVEEFRKAGGDVKAVAELERNLKALEESKLKALQGK